MKKIIITLFIISLFFSWTYAEITFSDDWNLNRLSQENRLLKINNNTFEEKIKILKIKYKI